MVDRQVLETLYRGFVEQRASIESDLVTARDQYRLSEDAAEHEYRIKVLDFGMVKLDTGGKDPRLTGESVAAGILGTPSR